MKLNKQNLLLTTRCGLLIYFFLIKSRYRKTALRPLGTRKVLGRNPFNQDKWTLQIEVRDGVACHQDLELESFKGSVFDFAAYCFETTNRAEIYYLLNQGMHLGLKVEEEEQDWYPKVSYFKPPIRNIRPSASLSLGQVYAFITGHYFRDLTLEFRRISDPKQKREFKAERFPYVTFGGTFSRRTDRELLKASGLFVFDFDHLQDIPEARQKLLDDDFFETELLYVSPSGNGLKWVIRNPGPEMAHRDFFVAVASYLLQKHRLVVDASGKDVSRASFLAHDPLAKVHPRHLKLSESSSEETNDCETVEAGPAT